MNEKVSSIVVSCVVAFAAASSVALAAEPDGGVTYDFGAISERRFHLPKVGEAGNLVDAEPFKRADWGPERASWEKFVKLPSTNAAPYRLSFRYKMLHTKGDLGLALVFYFRTDPQTGKLVEMSDHCDGRTYDVWGFNDEWATWTSVRKEFKSRPGADTVKICLQLMGTGKFEHADPSVVAVAAEESQPVTFEPTPVARLDGVFQVGEGQAGLLKFATSNLREKEMPLRKCDYRIELPHGIRFLGTSFDDAKTLKTEPAADGGTVTTFRAHPLAYYWWRVSPTILVAAEGPVGTRGEGAFTVFKDGKAVSDRTTVVFEIVPAVKAAALPKRYMNGCYFYQSEAIFNNDAADRAYAQLMGVAGVQWVISTSPTPNMVAAWRKAGIRKITPAINSFENGYHLGDKAGRPAADSFVRKGDNKNYNKYLDDSTCPLAVIEEREHFLKVTVPLMEKSLTGCDGLWANWEPFMYKGFGCACERCTAAYEAYRKNHPETTVAQFRSILHGRMVRTIDKYVRRFTGGEKSVGFLPGVSWRETASSWRQNRPSPESEPIDYAADLEWLEPWGPYYYWASTAPYSYKKRGPLVHFMAAKDMREQVDRDFPLPKRPKLMAFPNGVQGNWISQPEWIGMALDSFFFNRWEATCLYFFPEGYDARYWREFARSTERAAKYEDFVLDGVRCDDKTELQVIREYAKPSGYVTTYIPTLENVPMLQQASYRLGEARIVAVFNFWEKGAAYFRLRVTDLPDDRYTVQDETGTRYASTAPDGKWTADDLAAGVFARVGAARTCVFEICRGISAAKDEVTTAQLAKRCRAELSALAEVAEEDARYEAANTVRKTDKSGEM